MDTFSSTYFAFVSSTNINFGTKMEEICYNKYIIKWLLKYTSKHLFHGKADDKAHGFIIYLFTFFKVD